MHLTRRHLLVGMAALPLASMAVGQSLDPGQLNLAQGSLDDQSGPLQDALLRAAAEGRRLFLPPGTYYAQNLQVPGGIVIEGIPGASILAAAGEAPIMRVMGSARVGIDGVTFTRGHGGPSGASQGLLEIEASDHIAITNCSFVGGGANGIAVRDAAADITHCDFAGHGLAALFAVDSRGLNVTGNSIQRCGNGGILIWGSQPRHDGSIVSGNTITAIGATNGGSGQHGNGINVFRCNDVIVTDNQVADCAFTAIRLNSTTDVTVSGNICRNSGDVAIYSEFAFSGTTIADNIVDGAAAGISITNLDSGGRLATCAGNIVRNIAARGDAPPRIRPFGIHVEAETAVSGNTVDTVAGIGIVVGHGEFLRTVAVTGNVISTVETGIGISVLDDPAPGPVIVTGNIIANASADAIVGLVRDEVTVPDLAAKASSYPHVTLADNRVN